MKTLARLLSLSALLLIIIALSGCFDKSVAPYDSSKGSSDIPEVTDIKYASPEYSDEMSPSEESLESQRANDQNGQYGSGADTESDEYKKTYGRSSVELIPIYFDFDQASIRSDQFSRLEQNADYLKNHPSAQMVIQGNSDERGTNEYNLALGERRALNAKTYLIELGINEFRVRTVSYGEERPLFTDQDEFSWAQNRRDDFILE